ncbi:protein-disulfide reductase DsbD family protein [Microbulbifer pacificus]|uniref:protein-disulfide reductase DsbD family protein n=1 Tax=Microbulbifer pacificus TaxID=407164 RepID=UPI002D784ED8|nr:thioredoxin family protein [Microbulbifer pacificus]
MGAQETASGDHVRVRWLAPQQMGASAETLGFYFEVDPGWHVYWRNAGDSGAAPRFDISGNGDVGKILWPYPERLPIEHLTNLGYAGNVAYLFDVTARMETLELAVNLEWLVCKVDCIPGFGSLTLSRPAGGGNSGSESRWNQDDLTLRNHFLARVPQPSGQSPWQVERLTRRGDLLRLSLRNTSGRHRDGQPSVFPLDGELLQASQPTLEIDGDRVHFTFSKVPGAPAAEATGFVVVDEGSAWQFDAIPIVAAPVVTAVLEEETQSFWLLVLAAFAGGVILNLMPCVFPVLSIKLFGLIDQGSGSRVKEGLLYSAGVLATFAILGGLLMVLRAGGAAVGWGFQLQSPSVVLGLIVLFWLMALSFSGVFEFGHRLMLVAGHSRGGSFVTGVLAVFVAAPCTGPFMGAALGAAAVMPAVYAMVIFLGLGAGLAAPFLLLCASPALLHRLPKPGPWMDRVRQLLAFPLYATVIWLLWVLGRMLGDTGWVIGTVLMLGLGFALWIGTSFSGSRRAKFAGYVMALLVLFTGFGTLSVPQRDALQGSPELLSGWQPFDAAAIAQARAENRAVFIDYTAAWCITCQVNKKLVLDTAPVQNMFHENDVLLIRADWTNQDSEITAALAELGRNSVPVYAWYAPGASTPELLPQILQERMIAALFE